MQGWCKVLLAVASQMHRQSYEQKRKAGNILSSKSLVYKQLQVNTNAAQVFVQIPQMIWHQKKRNDIADGTRRWKRLRSVAVGRNDLWYKCRHVVMHSKRAPTGYRATLSESITGVCIANRGCACGVPTAIDRVTPLGSFCEVLVPSAISLLSKNQASRWVGHECYFITLFKTL